MATLTLFSDADVAALGLSPTACEVAKELARRQIPMSVIKHAPIKTMAEGMAIGLQDELSGCICKNILVRDRSKEYFLIVVALEQKIDFKRLPAVVKEMDRVPSMAKEVNEVLGVEPGCLSALALVGDRKRRVKVVLDMAVVQSELVHMHPMCHDATVTLRTKDFLVLLESLEVATLKYQLDSVASATVVGDGKLKEMRDESQQEDNSEEQTVTPWEVSAGSGGIDYDKLMRDFGAEKITPELVALMSKLSGAEPHRFLRRGLFYTHRDLGKLLDAYSRGVPFYLYTGRGPSNSSLHIGHLVPFLFTKWLQDVFRVPLVIQLSDDEKFFFKEHLTLEETHRLAYENAKDIIACGFDPELTFMFSDLDYIGDMYPVVCKIQKAVTFNQARGTFGFDGSSSLGKIQFPAVEAAPAFPSSFPHMFRDRTDIGCLITMAIDQDPFFRVTRDVAPRLGWKKPALMHSKFFPSLQGPKTKMSGSVESPATVFVTDSPKEIRAKIHKYAFSGGQDTVEQQRRLGADLDVDVSYQYLMYLMEDEQRLKQIGDDYASGKLLTGEVKDILVEELVRITGEHQARRAQVTDETVRHFMDKTRKSLDFSTMRPDGR